MRENLAWKKAHHHSPEQQRKVERDRMGLVDHLTIDRFQPEIFVNFGGNTLANEARSLARAHGAIVVFPTHNYNYYTPEPFLSADVFIVPSQHSAKYYSDTLRGYPVLIACNLRYLNAIDFLDVSGLKNLSIR